MLLFKRQNDLQKHLNVQKNSGYRIGFVPTMGALHQGHIQLVKEASKACDLVVVSIFVNPTQFNDKKDFERYPVSIPADIQLLEQNGADVLYLPEPADIYPDGIQALEHYDLGNLEKILEGASRPGHFQGVCQVVNRLLHAVQPHSLFMGRKDFQQCAVIRRLLRLTTHNTELIICDTVRESDGLAMSSRNRRLNARERELALGIFKALQHIQKGLPHHSIENLKKEAYTILTEHQFRVDYIEMAHAQTLESLESYDPAQDTVILIAAFQGEIRLIDNLFLPSTVSLSGKH